MKRIDVPGIGVVEFPDEMSDAQIVDAIKANSPNSGQSQKPASVPSGSAWDRAVERGKQSQEAALAAGIGGRFGKTMLAGQRMLGRGASAVGLDSAGEWLINDADTGRAKLDAELAPFRERDPGAVRGGEFTSDLLVTAPVGGLLAKVAQSFGAAPTVVTALKTGGMTTGAPSAATAAGGAANFGLRSAAGGAVGGASAAILDPESAGQGAAIGAALPGVLKAAGYSGEVVGGLLRPFTGGGQDRIVSGVLREFADDPLRAAAALRQPRQQLVPGSDPLTAAAAGDVGLAGLTRGMQSSSPSFANEIANRAAAQNAARTGALSSIAGSKGKVSAAEDARAAVTDAMREGVLSRARPIDAGELVSKIDGLLANPGNAGRLAQAALKEHRAQIVGAARDGAIDARALYELRKDINLTLGGKLQGDAGNLRHASKQLIDVRRMIDDAIEAAAARPVNMSSSRAVDAPVANVAVGPTPQTQPATGWRDYLSTYADMSKPIDRMEALQDVLRRTQTGTPDAGMTMGLSPATLNNILKNEGDDLAKILTPEELQTVRNVAADMNAGTLALSAGKAVGSNTFQNLAQDRVLQSALGKIGGSKLATSTLGGVLKIPYVRANQQIQERIGEALMDPALAERLLSTNRASIEELLNPQLAYRLAPLLAVDRP